MKKNFQQEKFYFDWFSEKINNGCIFDELYYILDTTINYYLECKDIVVIDKTYVVSTITNLIHSIALGKNVTFSYFSQKINNLIKNLLKNQGAYVYHQKFLTLWEEQDERKY